MIRPALVACALLLCGCPQKEEPARASQDLLAAVKANFAEREKKVSAFALEGKVTEASSEANFEVIYRAPHRMRGTVRVGDNVRTYVFNGERLIQLDPANKQVIEYELNAPREELALFLAQLFGTLVPEGYRAPIIDFDQAAARKVSHPRAPQALELLSTSKGEGGEPIEVTYVFRWPSMDLLEKRMRTAGARMKLSVTEEHCPEGLKVCVPKKLEQQFGEQPGATTTLTRIDLGAAAPQDTFQIAVPEGFTVLKRPLKGGPEAP